MSEFPASAADVEARQRAAQSFRAVFAALPQAAIVVDSAGIILQANAEAVAMFGYVDDELDGQSLGILVPEHLRQHHQHMVKQFFTAPSVQSMGSRTEFPARHRDGSTLDVEVGLSPVDIEGNHLVLATILDVTSRKQAQVALRRSDERLKLALASAHVGVWEWDSNLQNVFWSPECSDILGYPNLITSYEDFADLICEEDRPRVVRELRTAIASREPYDSVFRICRTDGEFRWIRTQARTWFDALGNVHRMVGTVADITDQVQMEQELKTSRARLLAALEVGGVGTWEWDAINDALHVDEAGARLWGQELEDISGQPLGAALDRVHPDDVAAVVEQTIEVLAGQRQAISVDVRLLQADGSYTWVRSAGRVEMEGDRPARVTGANVDITRYKLLESQLRASEEQFAQVFESSPLGMLLMDLGTRRVVEVNGALLQMFGIDRHDVIGQPPGFPLGLNDEERARMRADVAESGGLHEREYPYKRRGSNEQRFASVTVISLPIHGQEHRLFIAADITERKRVELDLTASKERFQELAETIDEVFWLTDVRKEEMIYVSPAYEVVWGRSTQELYDRPGAWLEAIHPADREIVSQAVEIKQKLGTYDEQFRIVRPDGDVRWVRDRAFPVTDESGEVVRIAGVSEDITERLELERQLRQTQKMESVGELAGGVAHDFNNWLTVISSYTDFLEPMLPADGDAREFLGEIRNAAERAASLTRQLLAFSRQEVLEPRVLDLNTTVIDTEKMLVRLLGEDITVRVELAQRLAKIRVDPGHLVQVLMNLAVNARDAMPRGGMLHIYTRNVTLSGGLASLRAGVVPGEYVELSVTDTGIGMDAETMGRVFEPFFTTKGAGKGTGLGLAVVHGIIEQSGGHINVASEPGSGTTFTVLFPALPSGTEADSSRERTASRTIEGNETVLLVEDEESVRKVVNRALSSRGYRVLTAFEGVEALDIARGHDGPIHLLLTDVVMPGMDGREVADRVREILPGIRVLYSSGYTDDAVVRHGLSRQEVSFLQKPYTMDELLRTVRRVLDAEPN